MSPATSSVTEERLPPPSSMPAPVSIKLGSMPVNMPPYHHPPRQREPIDISLFELDPREVVDGVLINNNILLAPDPTSVGTMRETCPYCAGTGLQLVLRRHHVKRTHLFCSHCTRCYDVLCTGGYSLLDIA